MCLSCFSGPLCLLGYLTLYSSLPPILALHLLIIHATIWVSVPSDTLPNFLWVGIVKVALFRGHFHINAARELVTKHSIRWWQLSLIYFWVSIPLVRFLCTSLSLELPGRSPWLLGYTFELCLAYPRRYFSSDHPPIRTSFPRFWGWSIYYHLFVLKSPRFRLGLKAQYTNWALNPTFIFIIFFFSVCMVLYFQEIKYWVNFFFFTFFLFKFYIIKWIINM